MQERTTQQFTKRYSKIDLLARIETTLERPVAEVWPYVLHWPLWVDEKDYLAHHVAGTPDTEGEIKRITQFDSTGRVESSFLIRVTRIVPHQQLIYKILPPYTTYDSVTGVGTEVPMTGYEVMDLSCENDRTTLRVFIYAESEPGDLTDDEVEKAARDYTTSTEQVWRDKYFPKLRDLLNGA